MHEHRASFNWLYTLSPASDSIAIEFTSSDCSSRNLHEPLRIAHFIFNLETASKSVSRSNRCFRCCLSFHCLLPHLCYRLLYFFVTRHFLSLPFGQANCQNRMQCQINFDLTAIFGEKMVTFCVASARFCVARWQGRQ